MPTAILLSLTFALTSAALFQTEENLSLKSLYRTRNATVCDVNDEANFCKQIVVDLALNTVAVSHRCDCPEGFRCPQDVDDTKTTVSCAYDDEKHWNKCNLRCVPVDL